MSSWYDEYRSEKFKINGESYSLIPPIKIAELMQAFEIKDLIQIQIGGSSIYDKDDTDWQSLLQNQEELIQEYLDDSVGEFDNSLLINNIAFLAKKNNLRFGEIEKMLDISVCKTGTVPDLHCFYRRILF